MHLHNPLFCPISYLFEKCSIGDLHPEKTKTLPLPPPLKLNSLAAPKCVEGVITGYCMCQGKVRAQPGGNFVGEAKELN